MHHFGSYFECRYQFLIHIVKIILGTSLIPNEIEIEN